MMHVSSSIAPTYTTGVSVDNEKNISTVATSLTDDHWSGLNQTRVRIKMNIATVTSQVIDDRRWKWLTSTNLTE